MNRSEQTLEIARWEFLRWWKLRDQVLTIAFALLFSLVVWFVLRDRDAGPELVTLAVRSADLLALPSDERFVFEAWEGDLEAALATGEEGDTSWSAVLDLEPEGGATLHTREEVAWVPELRDRLERSTIEARLAGLSLGALEASSLLSPVALDVRIHGAEEEDGSRELFWSAAMILALALLGVFTGMTYQFVAITGEKQARVTELMLSAVSPQTWIDGKILGLSLYSLSTTFTWFVAGACSLGMLGLLGIRMPVSPELAYSLDLVWVVALASGGFLLWNALFAAIAATVNDVYTSSRGSLLMLPLLPIVLAGIALRDPDANWVRILAVLPPTAWAVMPIRIAMVDPSWWELVLSLVGTALSILFVRRVAGRVFELAILMVGKEPSWREIWRWSREPSRQP